MTVTDKSGGLLSWNAINSEGRSWFSAEIDPTSMELVSASDPKVGADLKSLLEACVAQNSDFREEICGKQVDCVLQFPNDWGLGSSSTLINNLADWAEVDAFDLLDSTFGGSGYDIAVAMEGRSVIYERHDGEPYHEEVDFEPSFADRLWFIHLGKKQDTAEAVRGFLADEAKGYAEIPAISRITEALVEVDDLVEFELLMKEHNRLVSKSLSIPSSEKLFSDYTAGITKYLGAWGGDFMLATGAESGMDYFRKKGLETIFSYQEMIAR